MDIIIFVILIVSILTFIVNYFIGKDGLSYKVACIIKNEYPIIIFFLGMYIIYNYLELSSKYSTITMVQIKENIFQQISGMLICVNDFILSAVSVLLNIEIVKILIVGYFIVRILLNENVFERFKTFIQQIKEITYKDFTVKMNEAKIEKEKIQKEIESMEQVQSSLERDDLMKKKIKQQILAIIIDDSQIIKYLHKFIEKNVKEIFIPINMFPRKVKLTNIEKLFEYESKGTSIRLFSLKVEIKDFIIEMFKQLKDEGIIYIEK